MSLDQNAISARSRKGETTLGGDGLRVFPCPDGTQLPLRATRRSTNQLVRLGRCARLGGWARREAVFTDRFPLFRAFGSVRRRFVSVPSVRVDRD